MMPAKTPDITPPMAPAIAPFLAAYERMMSVTFESMIFNYI